MRKTLIAVAFAGAALAPAASLTVAATLAPTAAIAAPKAKLVKRQLVQNRRLELRRTPLVRRPDLQIARRCFLPRVSIRLEMRRLRHAGYRHIRFVGRKVFLPRCAQFYYFSACRGLGRYRVIVRYIRFQRFVITQYLGRCLYLGPVLRRP